MRMGVNFIDMKPFTARLLPLLITIYTLFPLSYARANGDIITVDGITYKKVDEGQLTIIGFDKDYGKVYHLNRHVTVNRQEYTVVNSTPLKALNIGSIDSIAIPEFARDLVMPSDLRAMSNLRFLKVSASALGDYKDYRLIAKHLTGKHPILLDFFTFPSWATQQDGVHYSADGSTLLFTGKIEKSASFHCFYLPERVKHIAPYAIGAVYSTLFLVLSPSIISISPTQIKRERPVKKDNLGLSVIDDRQKCIYFALRSCMLPPDNIRFDPLVDSTDSDYEFQVPFAVSPSEEAAELHHSPWALKTQIEWRGIPISSHLRIDVYTKPHRLKLTINGAIAASPYTSKNWDLAAPIMRTVTKDTTLSSRKFEYYKLEPLPNADQRFLGFTILKDNLEPKDTIRTSSEFCLGIGRVKIAPQYANVDEYVAGFDYVLSSDKKTLKWWKNLPDDKDIAHLRIPSVTRCGANYLNTPPTSGSYAFPAQLTQIGPRAVSNIGNLRELTIDHDLTLEKSSLAGCSQLQIIRLLNDQPFPENAIRDAFFPDPVPSNLILVVPKENQAIWKDVRDKLGAPLKDIPPVVKLLNKKAKEASMCVLWKESIHAVQWNKVVADSIELPALAPFKVDFTPLPVFDFDSICMLPDGSSFDYRDTILATQDLAFAPKCHLVQYPVRFSSFLHGSMRIQTAADSAMLDSGSLVTRHTRIVLKASPAQHYRFARFTVNGQSVMQNPYIKTTLSPLNIVAFFKPILHLISFDNQNESPWTVLDSAGVPVPSYANVKGEISFDSIAENQSYTFIPKPQPGHKFRHAYVNGSPFRSADTTLTVMGPITLSASTEAKTCFVNIPDPDIYGNITLQLPSGSPVEPNTCIPWGETLLINANINKRYFSFKRFIVNGVRYEKESMTLKAETDTITIELLAEPINFTVYVEPDDRFYVSLSSPMQVARDAEDDGLWGVLPDQPITIALNAMHGWVVESMEFVWDGFDKESFQGAYKECSVKANLTVHPKLSRVFYHITLPSRKKAGTVIAYNQQLKEIKASTKLSFGDSITILPEAGQGYALKSLSINGTIVPPRQTIIVVTGNITVSALFDKVTHNKSDSLIVENDSTTLRYAGNAKLDTIDFDHLQPLVSVATIAAEAFAYNPCITTAFITGNVQTIESRAFFGCNNLRTVIIGTAVRYIGAQAFAGTDQLEVIDILQTNPDSLVLDPAILQQTRGADPHYVFRVPNESYDAFRTHPKWQHVTIVPQTVEWTFILESSDFQLNVTLFDFNGKQQQFVITQGESPLTLPGGSHVAIASASSAAQTILRVAMGDAATALPCENRALKDLSITVLQHETNEKKTGFSLGKEYKTLVQVAPNPTQSTLSITPVQYSTTLRYALYNVQGTAVANGVVDNAAMVLLNVNNLVSGVYILCVENEKEVQTLRIIKW